MTDDRAEFRAAIDRLIAAYERLAADRSADAWREWRDALSDVERCHRPVEARSVARARREA